VFGVGLGWDGMAFIAMLNTHVLQSRSVYFEKPSPLVKSQAAHSNRFILLM
jgi:hypothetical protein